MRKVKKVGMVLGGVGMLFLFFGIQLFAAIVTIIIIACFKEFQIGTGGSWESIRESIRTINIREIVLQVLFIATLASTIIFGFWYYFSKTRKMEEKGITVLTLKKLFTLVLLGVGMELTITIILDYINYSIFYMKYEKITESVSITGSMIGVLSAVILAPIGEESLCRGLVYNNFKKAMPRLAANILQAFCFGVLHGNLVQGTYAFAMGLVFGWVYDKYHSIYACMLLHFIVNGSAILSKFVITDRILQDFYLTIDMFILFVVCLIYGLVRLFKMPLCISSIPDLKYVDKILEEKR